MKISFTQAHKQLVEGKAEEATATSEEEVIALNSLGDGRVEKEIKKLSIIYHKRGELNVLFFLKKCRHARNTSSPFLPIRDKGRRNLDYRRRK